MKQGCDNKSYIIIKNGAKCSVFFISRQMSRVNNTFPLIKESKVRVLGLHIFKFYLYTEQGGFNIQHISQALSF